MFNPRAFDNTRPDGIAVLELVTADVTAPAAVPETEQERPSRGGPVLPGVPLPERPPRRFVPLKRTVLTGDVVGPLASLRLTHVFGFPPDLREQVWPVAGVVEALYRFPLPGDAAVTGVHVRFGDVEIDAHLAERSQAEEEYDAARREGRQATLLTRESADVFTLRVAGITAAQDVTVETAYVQLARPEGAGWTLRVPLTTAPRYVRSDEISSRHAQGQPLGLLRDPGHRFALDLRICGAASVESSTHHLSTSETAVALDSADRRVTLQEGEIVPDRDLVLSWRPAQDRAEPTSQVWLHDDAASDRAYFLALVTPPLAPAPEQTIPRELIVLVDHSGSMEGPKWAAADWAVKQLLADLDDRERFALGVFHNTTTWFDKAPCAATMDAVQRAYRFLDTHRDSGGTELGVALEQALSLPRPSGGYARHVIVITDAQVTDDGRITRLAEQEARRPDRRRISTLCIDAAPNSFLALDLAERGGGVARFLTSAPEEEDIATALDDVLATWARPVAAGLRLEVSRRHVEVTGGDVLPAGDGQRCAVALGDLPAGRSVWVAGRVPRGDTADLRFWLTGGRGGEGVGRESAAELIDLVPGTLESPALKALFGARRVLALEHLMHAGYGHDDLARHLADLGYNPDEVLSGASTAGARVYAENTQRDQAQALRALLVREALEFGLASAETAFVATRKEPGKPVEQTMVVANALPAGWSEAFVAGSMVAAPVAMRMAAAPTSAAMPAAPPPAFGGIRRRLARFAESGTLREEAPDLYADASMAAPFLRPSRDATAPERGLVVFSGAPRFEGGEAVLFDSRAGATTALPDQAVLSSLRVRFLDGAPDRALLDPDLRILVFVEDLASPRAQVRLVDLLRQQGERPLNLRKGPGQPVRIVLADPHGAWASRAPQLELRLGW